MAKKLIILLVLVALVIPAAYHPAQAQAKTLKIAVSLPDMAFPFFVHMWKQIQDEAAKLGNIELTLLDGKNDTAKQTADLEAALAQKIDGLLISPIAADAMSPAVKEVVEAKIPVVTIDRNVNADTQKITLAHVGADNVKGGEAQGNQIMKMFPNGAKIFNLQGTPGATPAIDRNKGLHNIIDPVKDKYQIVFEQTGQFQRDAGLKVAENGLTGQGTPDVINAANDDMALGAAQALKDKGLTGKVALFGFDALPEALQAIKDGSMTGTVEQFPGGQSRTALNILVDALRNSKQPTAHDTYLTPKMITKDNIKEAERIGEIEAPATPGATMAATMSAAPAATMAATAAK